MSALVLTLLCSVVSSRLAMAAPPEAVDVLIIGAGLSGMATAAELKDSSVNKKNLSFHVVELTNRVGGRVRTVEYQRPGKPTLTADSGMEEYWESNPAVGWLRKFKLPLRADYAASSMTLLGKNYYFDTPEEGMRLIFNQKERDELARVKNIAKDIYEKINTVDSKKILSASEKQKLIKISFKDWLSGLKLPKKVIEWVRISVECEIGTHYDRIAALDGIAEMHIFTANNGLGERSYRVVGGNEAFLKAFADHVGDKYISLNQRVTKIENKSDHALVTVLDGGSNISRVIRAKHVVSTIPLFRLFEVQILPPLSNDKAHAIQSQTWGAYHKVHVILDRKGWARFEAASGGPKLPLLTDSNLGVIYDGNPDAKEGSKILSHLIFGDTADRYGFMPQASVVAEVRAGLEKLFPGIGAFIEEVETHRYHPRAIASWPVGRSRYDALSDALRRPEGRLYFAGDFTESAHSDGAFLSSARVVKQILEGSAAPKLMAH